MRKRKGFNQKEKGTMHNGDAAHKEHERWAAHRLDGRNEHLLVAILGNESGQQQRRHQTHGAERSGGHARRVGKDVYQQTHDKSATDVDDARCARWHFQKEIDVGQWCGVSQQVDMVEQGSLQEHQEQDPKDKANKSLKHGRGTELRMDDLRKKRCRHWRRELASQQSVAG